MSKEQASLATRRFDQTGNGTVSLCDFLAFAGRPYAANDRPLEAKLRRVLLKAEAVREVYPLREGGRMYLPTAKSRAASRYPAFWFSDLRQELTGPVFP